MIYRGEFADIYDVQYQIDFKVGNSSTPVQEITLGETPCNIDCQSGAIFDTMKPSTCTIQVVTKQYLPDLYSPTPHGVEVTVTNTTEGKIVFHGWVTPCLYDQGYTYIDTVEIEAIDAISSLQYYDYTTATNNEKTNVSVISILRRACQKAGYTGLMHYVNAYDNFNLNNLCVSEANFFNDDDNSTAWKWYDVVDEVCKFLGWSCMPYGDDVYFIDYRYLANVTMPAGSYRPPTHTTINIQTGSTGSAYTSGWNSDWNYGVLDVAPGSPKLSLDEVYNKITVTSNTYDIEGIHQLDDNKYYKSINKEQGVVDVDIPGNSRTAKYGGFLGAFRKTSVGGYPSYAGAYSRITEDSGWKHYWYSFSPLANITNPSNPISWTGPYFGTYPYKRSFVTGDYTNGINAVINNVGAAFCKYVVGDDYSNASSCIMFLKLYDENRYYYYTVYDIDSQAPYVLEYESKEDLVYKPTSGTTWITIAASLLWQNNQTVNNAELKIVDEDNDNYVTVPFEADVKLTSGNNETTFSSKRYPMDEKKVYMSYTNGSNNTSTTGKHLRTHDMSGWGDGFKMWKMQVKIGDYYWNGSSWTTTDSTFFISITNSPSGNEDECIMSMKWMDIAPNNDSYFQETGKRKYAIPITSNSPVTHGKIRIRVWPPRFIAEEWETYWHSYTSVEKNKEPRYGWKDFGPCVFAKDFEIAIEYTNNEIWWDDTNNSDSDIVYSNVVDETYCNEFSGLELKINTSVPDKPISKSFVSDGDSYVTELQHSYGDEPKEQEKNLIDMYHEHYSKPCKVYTFNIGHRVDPFTKVTLGTTLSGSFVIDSQRTDLRKSNNEITLVEYKSDLT